jgi:hypothetical protein
MAKLNLASLAARKAAAETTPTVETVETPTVATVERESTQASIPILGPMTQPMARVYAAGEYPPECNTSGLRAAWKRRQNAGGVIFTTKPGSTTSSTPQLVTTPRAMILDVYDNQVRVTFQYLTATGEIMDSHLVSAADSGLLQLSLTVWVHTNGDLIGFQDLRTHTFQQGLGLTYWQIESVLPTLKSAQSVLTATLQESDDFSFAQAILTLANHFRVAVIQIVESGETRSVKRGAAYITAHKMGEALQARANKAA